MSQLGGFGVQVKWPKGFLHYIVCTHVCMSSLYWAMHSRLSDVGLICKLNRQGAHIHVNPNTYTKTTYIKQLYKDNTETWGNADLVDWQWQMCAHCKTHTCNHPQTPPKRPPSQTSRPEAQFPYGDRAHTLKMTSH